MDVVRFHREHRRTVFPTFLMAKQKIVWVISSTIIKYSLGELYQSGFQPISNLACDWSRSGDTQVFSSEELRIWRTFPSSSYPNCFVHLWEWNFLRFDADNALSVTFHFPGEYLSINCCENCFCLKLLIRGFCEPFSSLFRTSWSWKGQVEINHVETV